MMTPSSSSSSSSSSTTVAAAAATSATSSSPCAGCKFLRRKCQPDCVFAPYFPPDQPHKFAHVHKVFGASNVTKLLQELTPHQREDAVNSLAYEAEMRLLDPVYGCVRVISLLQHQLRQLQLDLSSARSELSMYQATATGDLPVGAGGIAPGREHHQYHSLMGGYEADMAAGTVGSNGAYDAGFMAAGLGPLANHFPKPRAAGGDERLPNIGPSS